MIVFYTDVHNRFILSRPERLIIGRVEIGMTKELPSAAQHNERTDSIVERIIFRMIEICLVSKNMSMAPSEISVFEYDYMLIAVCHFRSLVGKCQPSSKYLSL